MENAKRFELENADLKNAKLSKQRFGVENAELKNREAELKNRRERKTEKQRNSSIINSSSTWIPRG